MRRKKTRKIGSSDVRARSKAEITILGQDEEEKDAKNRTSRNSASELTNPLEMQKEHFSLLNRSIFKSELGVRPKLRFWAMLSRKQISKNSANQHANPLEMVNKNISVIEIAQF